MKNSFQYSLISIGIILALTWTSLVSAGQVSYWNFNIDYTNFDYGRNYTLQFTLDTNLSPTDYLKIIMPFSLHTSSTGGVPSGLKATYFGNCQDSSFSMNANINVLADTGTYFVSFKNSVGGGAWLLNGTLYTLTLQNTASLPTQIAGNYGPIEVYSVSSTDPLAIVYDSNPNFATFVLTGPPTDRVEVQYDIPGPNKNGLLESYQVFFHLIPKSVLPTHTRVHIFFSNPGFNFTSYCKSVTKLGDSISYYALPDDQFTCTVDTFQNRLVLDIRAEFSLARPIRIETTVTNPNRIITSSTGIEVRLLKGFDNQILERQVIGSIFSVNQQTVINGNLKIGWLLDYDSVIFPGDKKISLTKNTVSNIFYNSLRYYFQVAVDTPNGVELQVVLNLPTDTATVSLLHGSLVDNFRPQPGKNVNCYISDNGVAANRKIICQNVGRLFAGTSYFIGFKMNLASSENLHSDFGKISIYTLTGTSVDSAELIPKANGLVDISKITINSNIDFYKPNAANTMVSSKLLSSSGVSAPENDNNALGINYNPGLDQKLIFSPNFIDTNAFLGAGSITYTAGAYCVMNTKFEFTNPISVEHSTSSMNGDATAAFEQIISSKGSFGRLKISHNTLGKLQAFWTTTSNYFALSSFKLGVHASLYPDSDVLDFFCYSFDNINSVQPTAMKAFFFNAYTVTNPKPNTLQYAMVNYWNDGVAVNDGDYLPTLIRISGYMSTTEGNSGSSRFTVFFDDSLEFFPSSNNNGDYKIGCGSSVAGVTCYGYTQTNTGYGLNNLYFKRVDVDYSGNSPIGTNNIFQLLIPVKTRLAASFRKINLYLATTAQSAEFTDLGKSVFTMKSIFRLTSYDFDTALTDVIEYGNTKNNLDPSAIPSPLADNVMSSGLIINEYSLDITNSKVGLAKDSMTINAGHTDNTVIQVNSRQSTNSYNGAGLTFNVEWNFETSSTNYAWANAGSDPAGRCLKFFYNKDSTSDWRFGVYCPIMIGTITSKSFLTINSFLMPNVNGKSLPSKVSIGYSDNKGRLVSLRVRSPLEASGPAPLYLQSQTSLRPSLIPKNKKGIKVVWEFTTTNPITNGMAITVTFTVDAGVTWGSACKLSHSDPTLNKPSDCVAAGSGTSLVFTITCSTCPMNAGKFLIEQFGNIANTVDKQTTSFSMKTTNVNGKDVDESPADGQIAYDNTQDTESMDVSPVLVFSRTTKKAWSTVSLNFSTPGRPIWKGEKLVVNFGTMALDNSGNTNAYCKVYLTSNNSISYSWLSVSTSSFAALTVVAKDDILEFGTKFTLVCDNMKVPSTVITVKVSSNIQNSAGIEMLKQGVTDVVGLMDAAPLTANDGLKVTKVFNTAGAQGEVNLEYRPETDLATNSTITVIFPNYYSPRLSNGQNIFCQVNSTRVTCSFDRERTVVFSGLPSSVASKQPVLLRIAGVDIPKYATPRNFYIAAENDTNQTTVVSYGEGVDKVLDAGLPLNIQIVNSTVNTSFLNSVGTHNITANIPAYQVLENNTFYVFFGNEYKDMLDKSTLLCSMYKKGNNSFNYVRECSSFGNRVKIILGQNETLTIGLTPIAVGTTYQYTILLEKVPTPDEAYCTSNKITLAIGNFQSYKDVRDDSMKYKSYFDTNNQNPVFSFFKDPSLVSVIYSFERNLNGEFEIVNGIYSKPLRFVLAGGAKFNAPIIVRPIIANMFTNPNVIQINSGDTQVGATFVTNPNVFQNGFYYLGFETVFDPNNRYEKLPLLPLRIVSRKIKIALTISQFYAPLEGISPPITFDLSNAIPYDSITLAAVVPPNEFDVEKGQQGLIFSKDTPVNTFRFKSKVTAKIGTNYVISFVVSGPNTELYEAPSPIKIQIIPASNSVPVYTATAPSLTDYSTFTNVDLTCDQPGTIFIYLCLNNSAVPSPQEIEFRSLANSMPYDFLSESQEQYMYVPVYQDGAGKKLTVQLKNLLSQRDYQMTSFCKNQGDISSLVTQTYFSTKWNGGYLQRLDFQFSDVFTNKSPENLTAGLEAFICRVVTVARIPPESVTTANGQYCKNLTIPGRARNFSLTYQFPDSKVLQLYFNPVLDAEEDIVSKTLGDISNNMSLFHFNLKKNPIALLPQLKRILGPFIPPTTIPSYHPTIPVDIFTRNDSISVNGVNLDSPGFAYVAVDLNKYLPPTFMQLKQGINGNNTKMAVDPQVRYFSNNGYSFVFNGLQNKTEYRIIWVAAAEDPLSLKQFRDFKVQVLNTTESGDLVGSSPSNLGPRSSSLRNVISFSSILLFFFAFIFN